MPSASSESRFSETVLFVDDEPANLQLVRLQLDDRYRVLTAACGNDALKILEHEEVDVLLSDERMPGMRGIDLLAKVFDRWPDVLRVIVSAYCDADRLLLAMTRGHAHEYILKPWSLDDLRACVDRCLAVAQRRRVLVRDATLGAALISDDRSRTHPKGLVGDSPEIKHAIELARRVAASEATVLIRGETGTGKELFARLIHESSDRSKGPFVRVNCGALAEGLLESELFGHEPGAFTGALRTHKGRFELAEGGTLFLDEIGDIPPKLQVSLLRVLQERVFERVGGTRSFQTNVRIVAATHRDLEAAVKDGGFREDLFFRLNVVPLEIPSLRERRADVGALTDHFISKYETLGRRRPVTPEARTALASYDWPGNVRELENVVQRAVILAIGDELTLEDFCLRFIPADPLAKPSSSIRDEARDIEGDRIREAIIGTGGNLARAARMLGIPRTTLASRAIRLGLLL